MKKNLFRLFRTATVICSMGLFLAFGPVQSSVSGPGQKDISGQKLVSADQRAQEVAGIHTGAGLLTWGSGVLVQAAEKESVVTEDITPVEPLTSDLSIVHTTTKLRSKRWIQSFTKDSKYYYFIQKTSATHGHCRITRVKYTGLGKYTRSKMDLKHFGHGSNLDCVVYNGKTYLWTGSDSQSGSDMSKGISCFQFHANTTLKKHAGIHYNIPFGKDGDYVSNVYPAINDKGDTLLARFTYKGKQYFQVYGLTKGTRIVTSRIKYQIVLPATLGDFQGFDVAGKQIYTIEGSPRASFLKGYDKTRKFQPTIIRGFDYGRRYVAEKTVMGAERLSFREPEGIEVSSSGDMEMMFVSNLLTDQSCNIYKVKGKLQWFPETN